MRNDETNSQGTGEPGSTLLGAPSRRGPMNVFPAWKYTLIAFVCALGLMYAAPNVFQPDAAVQVRALDGDSTVGAADRAQITSALAQAAALSVLRLYHRSFVRCTPERGSEPARRRPHRRRSGTGAEAR